MKSYLLAAILAASSTVPSHAQTLLRHIATAAGAADIRIEGADAILRVGGQSFRFADRPETYFHQRFGDLVLVAVGPGGAGCPMNFAWLDSRPGTVRMSAVFGTCSDQPEVRWDRETVTVTLPSMVAGEGAYSFVWDGRSERVQVVPPVPEPVTMPPEAVPDVWIGHHPAEFLDAPEWQDRLHSLMSDRALRDLRQSMQLGNDFIRQGKWVVANGCQRNACSLGQAGIAMHRDGRLVAVMRDFDHGLRIWGRFDGDLPQTLLDVIYPTRR